SLKSVVRLRALQTSDFKLQTSFHVSRLSTRPRRRSDPQRTGRAAHARSARSGHRVRDADARAGLSGPSAGAHPLHIAWRREGASELCARARAGGAVPAAAHRIAPAPQARSRADVSLRRVDCWTGSNRATAE